QGPALDPLQKSEVESRKSEERSHEAGGAAEGIRLPDFARTDRAGSAGEARVIEKDPPSSPAARSRSLELTTNDWGNVGLLQTPTARLRPAGNFAFSYNVAQPYTHGNVFVTPFDW